MRLLGLYEARLSLSPWSVMDARDASCPCRASLECRGGEGREVPGHNRSNSTLSVTLNQDEGGKGVMAKWLRCQASGGRRGLFRRRGQEGVCHGAQDQHPDLPGDGRPGAGLGQGCDAGTRSETSVPTNQTLPTNTDLVKGHR